MSELASEPFNTGRPLAASPSLRGDDDSSILPGGCYPRYPMPLPWPLPEPAPDSLDEPVDWMTYPHTELYRMVHEGLDLSGATSVSASWARLGGALGEIAEDLREILRLSAQAWEGDAAESARHAIASLAGWADETGTGATAVSGCITIEIDNVTTARNTMPAPLYPQPRREPVPMPADSFTGGDFATASMLVADQEMITSQQHEAHKDAAATMARLQADSREVYATVPQFAAPTMRPTRRGPDEPLPAPDPRQPTPPQETSPQQTPGAPIGRSGGSAPVGSGASVGAIGARTEPSPGVPGPGVGGGAGVGDPGQTRNRPAAAASGRPGGATGMTGMPMGGLGGARGGEDTERKSPAYLKEDEDIWDTGEGAVAPPVIGEDRGRA